jgi:uncharacterized BrkB/YihY/UPF0761 family membrane protein
MTDTEPDWYGAEPQTPPRTWDFLLTVMLIVFMLVLVVVLFFTALSGGIFNAGCSNSAADCNLDLVSIGHQICIWAPAVVAIVAIVASIVRVLRRRIGFWVALLGLALMLGVFFLGRLLIDIGIPDAV